MPIRFLLIFILSFTFVSLAYPTSINYNKQKVDTLKNLVLQITQGTHSDKDKSLKIFNWIIQNIKYDIQLSNELHDGNDMWVQKNSYEIMTSRKGICIDFAVLFKAMIDVSNIPCEIVEGYAKNKVEVLYSFDTTDKSNFHAWNDIFLDNKWQLVDCTWGAAATVHGNNIPNRMFLADPNEFILSHYPLNDRWQLLESKKTWQQFINYPYFHISSSEKIDVDRFIGQSKLIKPINGIIKIPTFFKNTNELGFDLIGIESTISLEIGSIGFDKLTNEILIKVPADFNREKNELGYILSLSKMKSIEGGFTEYEPIASYLIKEL